MGVEWHGGRDGYRRRRAATVVAIARGRSTLESRAASRRRTTCASPATAVEVDGPVGHARLRRAAAVHRPGRRGGERQPAGADARHGRQRRGRGRRRGGGRPAGAGARGDEDAAHREPRRTPARSPRSTYEPGAQVASGEVLAVVEPTEEHEMTIAFTESEERLELRKAVAKLAGKYGREWFTEKARVGRARRPTCGSRSARTATSASTSPRSTAGVAAASATSPRSARSWPRRAARCC